MTADGLHCTIINAKAVGPAAAAQAWRIWRVTSSSWAGSFHHTFAAAAPAVSTITIRSAFQPYL